jgi:hypothetical protein
LWFQAVAKACGEAARVPGGRTPVGGAVVEGAVVDVDGSVVAVVVVADSVVGVDVDVGRVGAAVVEGAVVVVDGSVVAVVVVADSVVGVDDGVVGVAVDEVGTGVVAGCVGGVPLFSASCATMRRTAAPCV